MYDLLYLTATVLTMIWATAYFGYHAGNEIHLLLVLAAGAILLRIIRGFTGTHNDRPMTRYSRSNFYSPRQVIMADRDKR